MEFRKIENSVVPELDGKIIAWTDEFPDKLNIQGGSNPSLWALLVPAPIKPGSYKMFYDLFAEKRKNWVDGDIDIFNDKLKKNTFLPAKIKGTFLVGRIRYIVLDICDEICFILKMGQGFLWDRPNISVGKDGYFWTEDFYEQHVRKDVLRKHLGQTMSESNIFTYKYRKLK